jgi:hypothetical protein
MRRRGAPWAAGKGNRVAAVYGMVQRKAETSRPAEPAPEGLCPEPPAPESTAESSGSAWSPSQDARSDAQGLLSGHGSRAAASSSAGDWCEKIANRLLLAFDALEKGLGSAERLLQEPADRTPPDTWALDLALSLALVGVTGPASAIIGRFVTRAITSGVLAESINMAVKNVMSHSVQKGVEAIKSVGKDREPAQKAAKNQMMDRFMTRQHLALQRAKGDAFDRFIDEVRPALSSAPESYLRSLHEHLSDLGASEELAYAQAARSITAWTAYLAYWTYGSFGSQVDFYKGLGSGHWGKRYPQGTVQIKLKPMRVPEPIYVGPRHDVIDGTPVEVTDMRIGGISDSAKAVLRENMQFIGDLRGIPMFVTFQAHMMPSQKSIFSGMGSHRREFRTFKIEIVRQPDGSVMLSQFHAGREDEWLTAYYDVMFGGGSAQAGARDIFDQVDRVPLPDFR